MSLTIKFFMQSALAALSDCFPLKPHEVIPRVMNMLPEQKEKRRAIVEYGRGPRRKDMLGWDAKMEESFKAARKVKWRGELREDKYDCPRNKRQITSI